MMKRKYERFSNRLVILAVLMVINVFTSGCQKNDYIPKVDNISINAENKNQNVDMENDVMKEENLYYSNPINSIDETTWYDYGTGDPYVLRHNGVYYLYCSTRDTEVGIKCWSSRDLINWDYEGLCSDEAITKGAYAPEVVYYNGKFYMYTSPAGNGHYVLSSETPIGPFRVITNNMGMSIDGSVFIDDDGKWYFYHSDVDGIRAHTMSSPSAMDSLAIDVNAKMAGWTEGPLVIKHDGRYYLTYTGNHVFSKGYRIDYGVGNSPISFAPSIYNPILIHTEGDVYGIGHSSSVKGPDLDSYYMIYHTLIGRAVEGMPKRVMNIDRIVFNGDNMDVLGPTWTMQQKPDMPKIYSYFDSDEDLSNWVIAGTYTANTGLGMENNSQIISKEALGEAYTAEFNVSVSDSLGEVGGIFSYTNDNSYGRVGFDTTAQQLVITFVEEGVPTVYTKELPTSFGEDMIFTSMQAIQVEKHGDEFTFYVNDHQVAAYKSSLAEGKIGYYNLECNGVFGFIGGTNEVNGSSSKAYIKPVPGTIQAVHYSGSAKVDIITDYVLEEEYLKNASKDDWFDYPIQVAEDGAYDFTMQYATAEDKAAYALYLDDILVSSEQETLISTNSDERFMTEIRRGIHLKAGEHILKLQVVEGALDIRNFTLIKKEEVKEIQLDFNSILDNYTYSDGKWKIIDGKLILDDKTQSVGKRLYGSENWGDYTVKSDITVIDEEINAGILFRVTNPSLGEAGNSSIAGTNFLQGYFAGISLGELVLGKQNYSWETLQTVPFTFEKNHTYHMKVTVVGDHIKVFIDEELFIEYTDANPFTQGKAGVRGHYSVVEFDNFSVSLPVVQ